MRESKRLTVAEVWKALITSEKEKILLAFPDTNTAEAFKRRFSTYKSRLLAKDEDLAELLGPCILEYNIIPTRTRVTMSIEITEKTRGNTAYNVEILPLEEEGQSNG